jgi:glutamyl/glutaminyl-tRNA synthetase
MQPVDLATLAARLPARPLTRFAPSPTGYLHLGHTANAVWTWGVARALGGRVVLRVEDHDRGRCRPEFERALLDDLEWLGLEPDLGAAAELRAGPSTYRQSDAGAAYEAALARLGAAVFVCECSRKDLARSGWDMLNEETRYGGRCRDRGLPAGPGRGLRLRVDPGIERFEDARLGARQQEPSAQCGDLLLRERLGRWTYHLAVVVDDLRHGVDLVVRGEDLVDSTGRQILLATRGSVSCGRRGPARRRCWAERRTSRGCSPSRRRSRPAIWPSCSVRVSISRAHHGDTEDTEDRPCDDHQSCLLFFSPPSVPLW